jgi:hypothetical protein
MASRTLNVCPPRKLAQGRIFLRFFSRLLWFLVPHVSSYKHIPQYYHYFKSSSFNFLRSSFSLPTCLSTMYILNNWMHHSIQYYIQFNKYRWVASSTYRGEELQDPLNRRRWESRCWPLSGGRGMIIALPKIKTLKNTLLFMKHEVMAYKNTVHTIDNFTS